MKRCGVERLGFALLCAGVMILKPFLNLLALGCKHDTLPFQRAGSLDVFGHNVGILIEYLDDP